MTLATFAQSALDYCRATNGSVTSWGRTPKRNTAVGGHPRSYHLQFLAIDVVYDAPVPLPEAKRVGLRLGLKVVREKDHDHLQPLPHAA